MSDIIVIGGGVAGLSAAARLSNDGTVTVLEAEDALGYHASGRSAALFEQNYGSEAVKDLNRASADFFHHANGGYLSPRGLMVLGKADEREAFLTDIANMGLDEISVADALKMVPIFDPEKLAYVGYHSQAQDIDTDKLLQDFARSVRANGGQVLTGQRVEHISYDAGHWNVRANGAEFTASTLINAAGAWADGVAGMAGVAPIGIQPYRRSMARIPAPGRCDLRDWPMFFGVNESWYAKPDAGHLIVSPADETPVEAHDAWAEDLTLAEGLARYEEFMTQPVTRLQSSWAGLRSFAPDRTLVLGRDPTQPAFVWCAGQGGYGFQSCPAASQVLADGINARSTVVSEAIVTALRPDRFR